MIETAFKVLLVEDNNKFTDLVRDALACEGTPQEYDIVVVSRMDKALDVADDGGFDLILLGISVPNADSIEDMKSLCIRSQGTPIVVLTGENDTAFASQAIQSGTRDCLCGNEVSAPLLRRVAGYAIERNRIQRRLDELRTKTEREEEISKLATLCGPSNLTTTLKSLSSAPLVDARPKEFSAEIKNYGTLLDRLLSASDEDEKNVIKEDLHGLADRLGALNAGPRDLVEIHKAALSQRLQGPFITDSSASIEEGRLLLLQLMGHLVSYYRRLSWGRRFATKESGNPSRQTAAKRREKD